MASLIEQDYVFEPTGRAGELEIWYSAIEVRIQGSINGPALLLHRAKTWRTVLLHPCCGQEWYVTERGAGDCGKCRRSLRPTSEARGWVAGACSTVFAEWNPLEQELLIEAILGPLSEDLDPETLAARIESKLKN